MPGLSFDGAGRLPNQYSCHLSGMTIPSRLKRRIALRYLQWSIVGIITLFPIVIFIVPKGANTSFYLLLLLSLAGIACRYKPLGKTFTATLLAYWPIVLSMAGLVIATLFNQLSSGDLVSRAYDMPSRLACFAFLLWLLLLVPYKHIKHAQWGWIAGAILCAAILYIQTAAGANRPDRIFAIPLIPFGNIAMVMGVLALLSIGWNRSDEKVAILLKLLAGCAALYGSYLSKTRGGWIVLPIFIAIAVAVAKNVRLRHKLTFVLLAAVLLCSVYAFSRTVQERIGQAETELSQYFENKNPDTSIGIRFQLWHGSWVLFYENPVFGIGPERYPEGVRQLVARHIITPAAADHPHSHNEVLFHMVTLGIFGLLAILSLYIVPAYYFFREIDSPDRETRSIAGMGLALTLGFFVFGLSDVMFYWTVSHTFYAIVLAVLFAHLVKRKAVLNK
jgi:O-antigen ligase